MDIKVAATRIEAVAKNGAGGSAAHGRVTSVVRSGKTREPAAATMRGR